MSFDVRHFIAEVDRLMQRLAALAEPWRFVEHLPAMIDDAAARDPSELTGGPGSYVHRTAIVEEGAILKPPYFIGPGAFIGANAYLRGGVVLLANTTVGPSVELKASILFPHATIAHLSFIGNSLIGSHVNMEAGAVTANHHNDRLEKAITLRGKKFALRTALEHFGSIVGDRSKIGANAVLDPGCLIDPDTVIGRLVHVTT